MPIAELGDADLYYQVHGSGPPVLGIMGFGADQRLWAGQIPAIAKDHSFILFDNRGAGRSTGQPGDSIEIMAEDAVHLLDHLGIEKAAVFGISMGGAIAQRVVIDHPERVSALILALTFARPLEFMKRQWEWAREVLGGGEYRPEVFIKGAMLRMFTARFFEVAGDLLDRIMEAYDTPNGPVPPGLDLLLGQIDAIAGHNTLAELPTIKCPTLVLGAKQDQMVPFIGSEEIAAAIPHSEFTAFETGHGAPVEEMQAFNDRVVQWLLALPRNASAWEVPAAVGPA
ncbi:MAG: alpha/beta fold hydrolase [Actinomycetota bacterium]